MTQDQNELLDLKHRIGEEMLSKRLRQQVNMSSTLSGEGRGRFHWENLRHIPKILNAILRGLGVLERGLQNTLKFSVDEVKTQFVELPKAFDGYRVLPLSDLHLDGMLDKGQALIKIVRGLEYDICVMTGDFRFRTVHDYDETLKRMAVLMENLSCPDGIFGVLGNHDFIEKVPRFEKLGLRVLLNESVQISRGVESIHLAGIDDPHFYGTQDIRQACADFSATDFSILLAHSPEVAKEAAAARINLYLSGHTHGGQICLPGGIPILTNSAGRRRFTSGRWRQGQTCGGTPRAAPALRPFRFAISAHRRSLFTDFKDAAECEIGICKGTASAINHDRKNYRPGCIPDPCGV